MKFTESELTVLKNFAGINQSMIIHPDKFEVMALNKTLIAYYNFEKPYEFEPFGIYDTQDFLSVINAFKTPDIEVKENHLQIKEGNSKVKYYLTEKDMIPAVLDYNDKLSKMTWEMDFDLPAEKLNSLFKISTILKAKKMFFESDSKKVRLTVADSLDSSTENTFEVTIDSGIRANKLEDVLKIDLENFKLLPGDYTVKLTTKKVTVWSGLSGVNYIIVCSK